MRSDRPESQKSLTLDFNDGGKSPKPSVRPAPRLTLRFTDDEIERLRSAAAGLSLSAYVRRRLFSGETAPRKGRAYRPVADRHALARVLGLLGQSGIAYNLDRLARDARSGCLPLDQPTLAEIDEACAHVRSMRDQLVAALGLIESRSQ